MPCTIHIYMVQICTNNLSIVVVYLFSAGNIRVFCRVRPKIKEDGGGLMGNIVVDYDRDDNGLIYVNNKGRSQTFELDLVFTPESTQNQVRKKKDPQLFLPVHFFNILYFFLGLFFVAMQFKMFSDKNVKQFIFRYLMRCSP